MKIKVDQEIGVSYLSIRDPMNKVEAVTIDEYCDLIFDIDKNNIINWFEILSNDIISDFNAIKINKINSTLDIFFSWYDIKIEKEIVMKDYWLKFCIWKNNNLIHIIIEEYKYIDFIDENIAVEYI